jgi:hypothetical protein
LDSFKLFFPIGEKRFLKQLLYRGLLDKSFFNILFKRLGLKCYGNASWARRNLIIGHLQFLEEALQLR